jgi:hypothetical protein
LERTQCLLGMLPWSTDSFAETLSRRLVSDLSRMQDESDWTEWVIRLQSLV